MVTRILMIFLRIVWPRC